MRELTGQARIMHFGSVSLTDEPSRSATLAAVRAAKEAGAVVSYDPNYRPLLWESPGEAKRWMREGLSLADIVKVSDEELTLLTGETDLERGSQKLLEAGASLALVALGAKGAFFRLGELCGRQPTFDVRTVDTNGAGIPSSGRCSTASAESPSRRSGASPVRSWRTSSPSATRRVR